MPSFTRIVLDFGVATVDMLFGSRKEANVVILTKKVIGTVIVLENTGKNGNLKRAVAVNECMRFAPAHNRRGELVEVLVQSTVDFLHALSELYYPSSPQYSSPSSVVALEKPARARKRAK